VSFHTLRYLRIAVFLLPGLLLADQVMLKNGDRLTGKIVKKDGDKVTVKSEFLGEVAIPWSAVTNISSDEPLVVVLPGGKIVSGKIKGSDGKLEVVTPSGTETSPLTGVGALRDGDEQKAFERLEHPGLLELWAGYFDIGLSVARGNAKTDTFTTAFNASRPTRTDKTTLYFNEIYSTALVDGVSAATAQAVRGGWAYDRNVGPRLFVNVFNDYEYDKFQNLDLRFVAGGGVGLHVIKTERNQLDLPVGVAYNRESYSTPLTRNSAEGFWGDDWNYKFSGATSVRQSFRMFDNLTDLGTYRMNFDLGSATTLKKWLSWQVTASDRFLSNPVIGRQRNDILLTTGFRISFAR
jgi:hypothetical protein